MSDTPPEGGSLGSPVDLAALLLGERPDDRPTVLHRSDGQALLYRGAINDLHGEPGGGKSLLAAMTAMEVARAGGETVYLDYEDSPWTLAGRMDAMGATDDEMAHVHYLPVGGPFTEPDLAWLVELVATRRPALVVVDSVGEALAYAEGTDDAAVASYYGLVLRPLARLGACVLLLDRVTKDRDKRGRYALGSQRKLAAIDGASYLVEQVDPWSRERSGRGRLMVAKDRRGHVGPANAAAAEIRVTVANRGRRLAVSFNPPADDGAPHPGGIRHVMLTLERDGGLWRSVADAQASLGLSESATRAALASAVRAGGVVEEQHGLRKEYRLAGPGVVAEAEHVITAKGEEDDPWF